MKICVDTQELDPKQLAMVFWDFDCGQQAEFFEALMVKAGSHKLLLQSLACRDSCKKRSTEALDGMQYWGVGAFQTFEPINWRVRDR